MNIMQQIDSLVVRTHGTPFHADIMELRSCYLAQFIEPIACDPNDVVKKFLSVVSRSTNVSIPDILSIRRTRDVARARHLTMYALRRLTTMSTIEISRALRREDHSTTINAIHRIEASCSVSDAFRDKVNALLTICATEIKGKVAA